MAGQRINDDSEFIWYSNEEPPIRGSKFKGARGQTLDTGEQWIYDGNGWVPDLKWVWILKTLKENI